METRQRQGLVTGFNVRARASSRLLASQDRGNDGESVACTQRQRSGDPARSRRGLLAGSGSGSGERVREASV
jgi:hypothetical protein